MHIDEKNALSNSDDGQHSAIWEIASVEGRNPEEVLAGIDRRLDEQMAKSRRDCVLPDDLVEFQQTGKLGSDLEQHRLNCKACDRLLLASAPDRQRIQKVRELAAATAKLNQQLRRNRVEMAGWSNWRVPTAFFAMTCLVVLVFFSQGIPAPRKTGRFVVSAVAKQPNQTEVPVTVRLPAANPASVSDEDVDIAASAAALAKNPPAFTVGPYGNDDLHKEATEKAAALLARMTLEWPQVGQDKKASIMAAAKEVGGVTVTSFDPTTGEGEFALALGKREVKTDFNVQSAVKTTALYEAILAKDWGNEEVSKLKEVRLDDDVRVECSRMRLE